MPAESRAADQMLSVLLRRERRSASGKMVRLSAFERMRYRGKKLVSLVVIASTTWLCRAWHGRPAGRTYRRSMQTVLPGDRRQARFEPDTAFRSSTIAESIAAPAR